MNKSLSYRKVIIGIFLLLIFAFSDHISIGGELQPGIGKLTTDTAYVPKEIEDPENIGINKEASHASLMPYGSLKEALASNRYSSSFCVSLNGVWKFNWVEWPQKRPVDFYKTNYDISAWKDIKVPSNWQMSGSGTPYYNKMSFNASKLIVC